MTDRYHTREQLAEAWQAVLDDLAKSRKQLEKVADEIKELRERDYDIAARIRTLTYRHIDGAPSE